MFDYNVGLNEIVQLMVKPELVDEPPAKTDEEEEKESEEQPMEEVTTSDKENDEVHNCHYSFTHVNIVSFFVGSIY